MDVRHVQWLKVLDTLGNVIRDEAAEVGHVTLEGSDDVGGEVAQSAEMLTADGG